MSLKKSLWLCALSFTLFACGSSSSTKNDAQETESAPLPIKQDVEQGKSIVLEATWYDIESGPESCVAYWKDTDNYESLYGVQKTANGRQLTLLLPHFKDEYTLNYDFSCDENKEKVVEKHSVFAFHSYLPSVEGSTSSYRQNNIIPGFAGSTLQKAIRSSNEEFFTFLDNGGSTLLRSYWNYDYYNYTLKSVSYDYLAEATDYDVSITFDPAISYVSRKTPVEGDREVSTLVSLQASPDHPNIQEYSLAKKLRVSTQKKNLELNGKTYEGFEVTVQDVDGKEILPPRFLVKDLGAVQEKMPKLFADLLGLPEAPSYLLIEEN